MLTCGVDVIIWHTQVPCYLVFRISHGEEKYRTYIQQPSMCMIRNKEMRELIEQIVKCEMKLFHIQISWFPNVWCWTKNELNKISQQLLHIPSYCKHIVWIHSKPRLDLWSCLNRQDLYDKRLQTCANTCSTFYISIVTPCYFHRTKRSKLTYWY